MSLSLSPTVCLSPGIIAKPVPKQGMSFLLAAFSPIPGVWESVSLPFLPGDLGCLFIYLPAGCCIVCSLFFKQLSFLLVVFSPGPGVWQSVSLPYCRGTWVVCLPFVNDQCLPCSLFLAPSRGYGSLCHCPSAGGPGLSVYPLLMINVFLARCF